MIPMLQLTSVGLCLLQMNILHILLSFQFNRNQTGLIGCPWKHVESVADGLMIDRDTDTPVFDGGHLASGQFEYLHEEQCPRNHARLQLRQQKLWIISIVEHLQFVHRTH